MSRYISGEENRPVFKKKKKEEEKKLILVSVLENFQPPKWIRTKNTE